MAKKETASPAIPVFPMLKTVEQMSKISGIGENKLRELMDLSLIHIYMWLIPKDAQKPKDKRYKKIKSTQ